ncbi:ABC transporter permease [Rhizobium leguminosarum]|uniref:ABC transporter permease n=1 Tax=Rhizobium leguminosarum TaxID=384 RepID=UPI001C908A3D|nr:ABC transporter permease [Rhizobium leguminosarum]MBY3060295.1 ABC transporter permease [Rhizobium leguminosarum]
MRLVDVVSPGVLALLIASGLALAVCSLLVQSRPVVAATALLLLITFGAILWAAGSGATGLAAGKPPGARTSLGLGFWLLASAPVLCLVDLSQQAALRSATRAMIVLAGVAIVVGLAAGGAFDNVSVMREYRAHADTFRAELMRHAVLVAAAVAIVLFLGLPLGILGFRRPRFGERLLAVLGIIQTVPSIALFGLLIGPLTSLGQALPWAGAIGIAGIGTTPAVIALVLYGLLPLVRNTIAGLEAVSPAIIDAARGNGMSGRQILAMVTLPLALPVILSGLRVVCVQTVGLAVVAALIGAGGLGTFVFQGLGQNAVDLVMLGVLPTILFALAVDAVFALFPSTRALR